MPLDKVLKGVLDMHTRVKVYFIFSNFDDVIFSNLIYLSSVVNAEHHMASFQVLIEMKMFVGKFSKHFLPVSFTKARYTVL